VASVREIGREPVGVLRALMPMGLPPHALTPLFAALRTAFPRLSLQLRFSEDPVSSALEDVDLLVHFGPEGPAGPWLSHEVWRLREWLLASRTYLERRGTPTTLEDLARHDLLVWNPPGEDPRVLPTRSGESFEIEPVLISADVHCIRQMVLADLGIGFVPDAMLPDPGVPEEALVPVLPDVVARQRSLFVVFPAAQAGLPKLRAILQHVRAFAERAAALRGE
jgi:DNA-binding transcriptional LysR family regulator